MPKSRLARFALLPELELEGVFKSGPSYTKMRARKVSAIEVCPKCASPSKSIYDHRSVTLKDAPIRGQRIKLTIVKRRFMCHACKKPFTEPVPGVGKGKRYTERFKSHVLWACENFCDLKAVRRHVDCSYGFIYKSLYEQLELKRKKNCNYPWPNTVGFDEHSFRRNPEKGYREFVSFVIDHKNRKAFEVVHGRSNIELQQALAHIPGRQNVNWVTMDLSETYRSFARKQFPNARIVADKFHVVRLLNPAINKRRKEITGDRRTLPVRRILLANGKNLNFETRLLLSKWLERYPRLKEIYLVKEALHKLYRTRGIGRAKRALINLLDFMGRSKLPEILTLRRTLYSWREEILNYFECQLTNARVEGFNNVAKVIKKRAYGYRSFKNYRLRLLSACT